MSTRAAAAALCLAALLVGCSSPDPEPSPATSPEPQPSQSQPRVVDYTQDSATPSAEETERIGPYVPTTVQADPAAFKELECREPSPEELAEYYRRWGVWLTQAAVVDLGEGLEPGSEWSLLAFIDDESGVENVHLTDRPRIPGGTWIILSSVKKQEEIDWRPVEWDPESLARAQAGVELALECIR